MTSLSSIEMAPPETAIYFSFALWLLVLEAGRRAGGLPLVVIVGVLSLYPVYTEYLPTAISGFASGPAYTAAYHAMGSESILGIPLRTLQATAARAGTTIGKMITTHRLQRAAQLLLTRPDQPVTQVALDCGFADPSYFARRFQQALGTSPRKYRLCN